MEYPFKNLLPLDEVLEREGYYKDWTHLDPKVFYSLTQISEYIKTKGFGVDVRLLIAQLAEHFSLKTSQINQIELFFKDVMQELAEDKDFHSLPEIAGARGGFDTLGARLNNTTTELAQIEINKVDKNGSQQVAWANIAQDAREQIIGTTPPAVVGRDSVGSANITPNAVQTIHADFINKSSNLVDENDLVEGHRINHDGSINTDAQGYGYSHVFRIKPDTTYYAVHVMEMAFYDENGAFIERKQRGDLGNNLSGGDIEKFYISPPGAYLARINKQLLLSKTQVSETTGQTVVPHEPFYQVLDEKITLPEMTNENEEWII